MTTGGVTVKVLTGRVAVSLQRYRDSLTDDQDEEHLYDATRHCSHDLHVQIGEWAQTRRRHGTDGAVRRPRARYEVCDDDGHHPSGAMGDTVRVWDGKRWRKRPARPGETPTHLRIEPDDTMAIRDSEATHTIYAAGADLVNPENPEESMRFFDAVVAHRQQMYPGLQESIWAERNGKSGLVHVHVASNATIFQDFTLEGHRYRAGQKMAGDMTNVDATRARFEQYLDTHPEHGLIQSLARVGTPEYDAAQVRSSQKDYWEARRGNESSHDYIRRAALESMRTSAGDRDRYVTEMANRGIVVEEAGLRRGRATKKHDYTYRLTDGKARARGATIGPEFSYDGVGAMLELAATGQEIEARRPQHAGPAKPLPYTTEPLTPDDRQGLLSLRHDVEEMARRSPAARTRQAKRQAEKELGARRAREATGADKGPGEVPAMAEARAIDAEMARLTHAYPEQMGLMRKAFIDDWRARHPAAHAETVKVNGELGLRRAVRSGELETELRRLRQPSAPTAAEKPVYTSRLRGARVTTEKMRLRRDALADLDEHWHTRVPTDESSVAERRAWAAELRAAGGIGPKMMGRWATGFSPDVADRLRAYVSLREVRRAYRDALATRKAEVVQRRTDAKRYRTWDEGYWQARDRVKEAGEWVEYHQNRVRALDSQIRDGVYATDTPELSIESPQVLKERHRTTARRTRDRTVETQETRNHDDQSYDLGLG